MECTKKDDYLYGDYEMDTTALMDMDLVCGDEFKVSRNSSRRENGWEKSNLDRSLWWEAFT